MPAAAASQRPIATRGARMNYLIKRKPTTSREELVAHWFANHMPGVIAWHHEVNGTGQPIFWRYIATLFDATSAGEHPWDGVAQLWWDEPQPRPEVAHGAEPTDSFQEKAEPYVPWATTEYVIVDGSDRLPVQPLTLNAPFPTTRSGFCKLTFLLRAKAGSDYAAFFDHWLDVHVPNVQSVMARTGGFRYVVSQSLEPELEPYAGMAEVYFPDRASADQFRDTIEADGMERWVDPEGTLVLRSHTEMVGVP